MEPGLTVPSPLRSSAGCIRTTVPAGTVPPSFRRGMPAWFWPKSKTHVPARGWVTATGRSSSSTRTGGASRATSAVLRLGGGAITAGDQPVGSPLIRRAAVVRSAPGSFQPRWTRRRRSPCLRTSCP